MRALIGAQYLRSEGHDQDDKRAKFCVLLYICLAHYPNGIMEGCSTAEERVFDEFIEILKDREFFDYHNVGEWNWAYTVGCANWLERIIQRNIDDSFVKPLNGSMLFQL